MSKDAAGSPTDPLYDELLEVGRDKKTIRADALEGYEHLLTCADVQRRAGPRADTARRAACANEAIRDAVASIVSPLTRAITEAALCVTKEFEGLSITDRIRKLPDTVTERKFQYHRKLGLEVVVAFLRRDRAPSKPEVATGTLSGMYLRGSRGDKEYEPSFLALAIYAAELHYAALGVLFAYDFDEELSTYEGSAASRLEGTWWPRTTLSRYMYDAYMPFVYERYYRSYLDRPLTHKYLSADAVQQLHSLWQQVADGTPAGPNGVADDQREHFLKYDSYIGAVADTVYYEKWADWCKGRGPVSHERNPEFGVTRTREHLFDAVTPIAAASGGFLSVLTRNIKFDTPIHRNARIATYKALANGYPYDEWEPLMNGRPMRYRVEAYFDVEGPALTHMALL